MRHTLVLVALAGLLALAGCGDDGAPAFSGDRSTTTHDSDGTVVLATTTSIVGGGATTTAVAGADAGTGDFEGQRFDFGAITLVESVDGAAWIQFNRQQLYQEDGSLASGPQLTEEPILYGSTDVPYVDDSPKLRRFVLEPDATVLRIEDPVPCASDDPPGDPVWTDVGVDGLLGGAWRDRTMDSLTFGPNGRVSQVRLSAAC